MSYEPNPRRRSDAELRELREGARERRQVARRAQQSGDPVLAEVQFRQAEHLEAEIQMEMEYRQRESR
ncbi:hypothetical protein ACFW2V_02755 [Streptomyces sp. NPDC058947]|uniref:hypothetical protein n=1 Tax=Streptomyces sp. NPDC058947 TaxID=3346675 RepID=UPI0036CAA98C